MSRRPSRAVPPWLLTALLLWPQWLPAHDGVEHDSGPAPSATAAAPRVALQGTQVEAVLVHLPTEVLAYIDALDSNAPVTSAEVRLWVGSRRLDATADADGVYHWPAELLATAGPQPVRLTVQQGAALDTLEGTLPAASADAADHDRLDPVATVTAGWLLAPGALAGALLLALALRARRRRR